MGLVLAAAGIGPARNRQRLVTSGILETAEFFLGTGSWDVDDLLLNVLGALLGYGAARVVRLGFRRA